MTRSEAGLLGAKKSYETNKKLKEDRIKLYSLNPKKCLYCNKDIEYNKRTQQFCNSSCSCTFNNKKRILKNKLKELKCLNCNKQIFRGLYCCQTCTQANIRNIKVLNGTASSRVLKTYLISKANKCSICNISEWNNKKLIFEIEHKDGNSENNTLENVCLICPNCHSQTDTYKGRNRGKGRFKRKLRYKLGKSY